MALSTTSAIFWPVRAEALELESIRKKIPSTGLFVPVIGLGTWITFNVGKDSSLRDNDLLQFALDRTENSMFDPVLHSYATGLLILLKTVTEPDAILHIGKNMAQMNPGMLRGVLDALPNKVYHDDIRKILKVKIDENN